MPSPFPGMDPYLEAPGLWTDVHHGLISEIQARLNSKLRPKYRVRVEERVYISDENDPGRRTIVPDLRVAETGDNKPFASSSHSAVSVVEPVVLTTIAASQLRLCPTNTPHGPTPCCVAEGCASDLGVAQRHSPINRPTR